MVVKDWRATVAGFVGAAVVLGVLLWVVGIDRIVGALLGASPWILALVVLVSLLWLLAWGLALRTVLAILGIELSIWKTFLVFSASTFANNITPFGQAGGEPFSAYLISRVSDSEYETGLAAIASVDALNFLPSVGLAAIGLGFFAATATLGDQLEIAAASIAALVGVVTVAGVFGWRYRYRVEAGVVRAFTPAIQWIGRVVPRLDVPSRAEVEHRIEGFFHTIERIGGDRRRLLIATGFSTLGWIGLSACMWLALLALGYQVSVAAPLIVIPAAAVSAITPLPGATGAIEAVQTTLLLATTSGVPADALLAAVLIHRGATYWLPVLIGGGSASALGAAWR